MEGLCLIQYLYQRVDADTFNKYQLFFESMKEFASYNQQYKMIEYHFDSQKYINLKDLLFLHTQKAILLSDQQLCQISLKIIEALIYLQSQITLHGSLREENIWIVTSKPLNGTPVDTEFGVVFSGLFSRASKNLKQDDDFKKIKTILEQIENKVFPKSWLSQLGLNKNPKSLNDIEQNFKANMQQLQKQEFPQMNYQELLIKQMLNLYPQSDFDDQLGIFGQVLRNNLLNFIVKTNKVKEFSQQIQLQQIFQKLKLQDLFGFIKNMIGKMQTVINIQSESVFVEQSLICQHFKYTEIFNSLEELQKNQPKPESCEKQFHFALIRESEEKEGELAKLFPQAQKILRKYFNNQIANLLLYFLWENLWSFVVECDQVVKKELLKLYKEDVNVSTLEIIKEGQSVLEKAILLFSNDLQKEKQFQQYLSSYFTIKTLQAFKQEYICTKQFVVDSVGQIILQNLKDRYFVGYKKLHEQFIKRLNF